MAASVSADYRDFVVGASMTIAALDVHAARVGIGRDLTEFADAGTPGWVALCLVFGLPVACAALLLVRRWLAVVPLAGSLTLFVVWFLYYATRWWANPGQGAWLPALGLVLVGWLLAGLAALVPSRARTLPEPG